MDGTCKEHSGQCATINAIDEKVVKMGNNFELWCKKMESWKDGTQRWLIGILASSLFTSIFIIVQLAGKK